MLSWDFCPLQFFGNTHWSTYAENIRMYQIWRTPRLRLTVFCASTRKWSRGLPSWKDQIRHVPCWSWLVYSGLVVVDQHNHVYFYFYFFYLSHTRLYREYITSSEMYSLHLTHPKWTHTRSSGQPCYSARGAVGGSVPCSRTPQSWYWRRRERWLFTPHQQSLPDPRFEPTTFGLRVRLSNHVVHQQPAYTLKNKVSKRFHSDTKEEPFCATEEHFNEQFLK